ncbi:ABC transporter permease [Streptomyces clavuligerus]|uniref:ABC transporter system integral membrane protein n=1 Tax=Streptomyces clavuligerus TaxID=1901 RepID=B5GQ68_STRCL|nr:ABC transporter permease [Streptomyces clavuligerus]ANW18273.1 ABC transporter permease [Streptomyces clavuligerus]AXU12836.1 ABC transporter permease [Streptomyces clavuligerus]EDY48464.1 ABC transporter system integral membrane protein [Streptomyces clavuligerus]EFG09111.1 ABC transporter system integral membrane protein [Streptomyces clavuligerus]MBY6302751.1 ABC transporter permease [Streptomyces clavuligerus]
MTLFLLKRLGGALLVLLALSALVHGLFQLAPGDPARLACGERCSPQQIAQVRETLGLDAPALTRYAEFLQGLVTGRDYSTGTGVRHCSAPCLGLSYQSDQQVTELIVERLPATASLALGALVIWLVVGVGVGLLSALRRGGPTERALTVLTLAATGMPVFILGLLLLMAVCAYLRWLPFPSYVPFTENPEQWAWNLLLPWLTLGLFESAKYARLTRSSTLETLAEDHIRTFRAYGVSERAIVTRHALRGAAPPVIALSALDVGTMFGGAVLTESLFGIPGLGKTLIDGVKVIDLPVVVGVVLVIGTAVVLAHLLADLLYALADRRVVLS